MNMETKEIKETKETAAIGGKGIQKDLPEMKIAPSMLSSDFPGWGKRSRGWTGPARIIYIWM